MRRLISLAVVLVSAKAHGFSCNEKLLQVSAPDAQLVDVAQQGILNNISPPGALPGIVLASPSANSPDYRYHWVRDAALSMDMVMRRAFARMYDYVEVSIANQNAVGSVGLGEVKYFIDGTPDVNWARPQNDGPALRAMTLMRFARELMAEGQTDYVRTKLYDGVLPTNSVIKKDLEYVAHHWQDTCYDLWEESFGLHFYTLAAQRTALLDGADLADALGDPGAAQFYRAQANLIRGTLQEFWDPRRGYVIPTLNRISGPNHASELDVAVVLAALHSSRAGEAFGVTDDRILATVFNLQMSFQQAFPLNSRTDLGDLGTAIGRYPEDNYDGYHALGNPWFLATNAFAELRYRARTEFQAQGRIAITRNNKAFFDSLSKQTFIVGQTLVAGDGKFEALLNALRTDGDRFIARTVRHMDPAGHLSEEFNRDTGYMQGANDLTWSYASLISALDAR